MKNRKTLSVLIPAFNEGESAARLVQYVLAQKVESVRLKQIIVVSDGSKDNTVSSLKKVKSKLLKVIDPKLRRGKAARLNQMFDLSQADVAVVFDADIVINDLYCIEKLVKPLIKEQCDMTSGKILELSPNTYFEEVLDVSMRIKRILFSNFKGGNNVYNCHGPIRAFTKELYKSINFKSASGEDMFSYLTTKFMKKRFLYVPYSVVEYRLPSIATDHYKQSYRYLNAIDEMKRIFGEDFVNDEFKIPAKVFMKTFVDAFPLILKYPTHVLVYVFTVLVTYIGKFTKVSPRELWQVASSKNTNNSYAK